jgi:nucleolar protein 16
MGRELQKRKRRSSRPAVRQPSSRGMAKKNPRGNEIIARNWDKTLTTTQNYRRLGLVGRLNAPTGGAERDLAELQAKRNKDAGHTPGAVDPFAIQTTGTESVVSEVRVERDADGRIVRILGATGRANPLNDPLNDLDTDSEAEEEFADDGETWGGIEEAGGKKSNKNKKPKTVEARTEVVRQLEAEANMPREKRVRNQSEREREWLASLVERHGDNVRAMARDRRLNPMQQTAADIAKRLRKFSGEQ